MINLNVKKGFFNTFASLFLFGPFMKLSEWRIGVISPSVINACSQLLGPSEFRAASKNEKKKIIK